MSQSQATFSQLAEIASLDIDKPTGPTRPSPLELDDYIELGSQLKLGNGNDMELLPLSQSQADPVPSNVERPASPPQQAPPPAALHPLAPPLRPVPTHGLTVNHMVPMPGPVQATFFMGQVIPGCRYINPNINTSAPMSLPTSHPTSIPPGLPPGMPPFQDAANKPPPRPSHHSMLKPEHRNSRANRRGPMDDMRQLVRILVKLMPDSAPLLVEDGTGGNRVSEAQIQGYLRKCLGDAPKPEWGIPNGWGTYLAALFGWVLGRHVSKDEAMLCARRQPGRSWETVETELVKMGLYPASWKLPLNQAEVQEANRLQKEIAPAPVSEEAPGSPMSDAPSQSTRNVAEALHLLRNENEQPRKKRRRRARATTATSSLSPVPGLPVAEGCEGASAAVAAKQEQDMAPQAVPPAAAPEPSIDLGSVGDVSQLSVEQCWQLAARCLQRAAKCDGSAPKEQHGQLARLHGFVLKTLSRDFQFLNSNQGDAATAGQQEIPAAAAAAAAAAGMASDETVAGQGPAAAAAGGAAAAAAAGPAAAAGAGTAAASTAAAAGFAGPAVAAVYIKEELTIQPALGGGKQQGVDLRLLQPPTQRSAGSSDPAASHAQHQPHQHQHQQQDEHQPQGQDQQLQQERAAPLPATAVKAHVDASTHQLGKGLQDLRNSLLGRIERAAESQGAQSASNSQAARQSMPSHHHGAATYVAAALSQ